MASGLNRAPLNGAGWFSPRSVNCGAACAGSEKHKVRHNNTFVILLRTNILYSEIVFYVLSESFSVLSEGNDISFFSFRVFF